MKDVTESFQFVSCSSYKGKCHFMGVVPSKGIEYWQTESGSLPHKLLMKLNDETAFDELQVRISPSQDESYCPKTIIVKVGSHWSNLLHFTKWQLSEKEQFCLGEVCVRIPLRGVHASHLALVITENLHNGRDSRIRSVRIFKSSLK